LKDILAALEDYSWPSFRPWGIPKRSALENVLEKNFRIVAVRSTDDYPESASFPIFLLKRQMAATEGIPR